jgi:DNA topoisomerase-1
LEEKGIGRPSTYAPTIYTLLERQYVQREGGALKPTEIAEIVVDLLVQHFPKILDFEFTALMEEELDKIEEGQLEWHRVLRDFYDPFSKHLEEARVKMRDVRREAVPTDEICDICGKPMVIRWGRFGQFLACSGFPDCRYTKSLPTGFRCPQPGCDGDLVRRQSKRRQTFYGCTNYPKCTYVTRRLPKEGSTLKADEKPPEVDLE